MQKILVMLRIDPNNRLYKLFKAYRPFRIFLAMFKFGAGLHYTLLAPLGEQVMPLWIVGILIGLGSMVQLIFDIPAWYLLDKYGYVRMLKLTTIAFIVAAFCLMFEFTSVTFILTLIFSSFWRLFFGPGANAYTLSEAPKADAGKFISFKETFQSVGIVLASAILAFIIPLPAVFIGVIIAMILIFAWLLLFITPEETVSVHVEKKIATHDYYIKKSYKHIRGILHKLSPVSTMLMLSNFASAIFYSFIRFVVPLMIANNQGWRRMGIGLGVFDFAVVIFWYTIGKIADRYSKKKLVFLGLLIFAFAGILLWFNFGILFIILWFIATTGDELASISLRAWLNTVEKTHTNDGKISWAINLASDLWRWVGPMLAGILYVLVGPSITITIGGWILIATLAIYYFLIKKNGLSLEDDVATDMPKPHRFRHKS